MRRVLGLFAHPDDEIFCAGGTIAHHAAHGAEARVVSFTRGEAGRIGHVELATRSTIGAVREAELAAACRELGAQDSRCLDFADGTLADLDRSVLVAAACDQIAEYEPDTVISFDNTGAYGHPDHIAMSEITLAACERLGETDPERAPERLLHAMFPRRERLLIDLLVDWLHDLPDRFRGSDTFVNALLMFADSSSMLGFAADHLRVEWFPRGSFIVEQGEPADSLYLLLSGSVEVRREEAGGSLEPVASIGVGEFIGETGLATGQPRNAHCIATDDCACFVLTASPDTSWKPRGGVLDDRATRTQRIIEPDRTPDLVVDVRELVDRKVAALGRHRSQYTIEPGLFPDDMLTTLLGTETFLEVWQNPLRTPHRAEVTS